MVENGSVAYHAAMGWAESIKWVQKLDDSLRMGETWCRKANVNEEHRPMKNINKMKIKNEMKIQNRNEDQQLIKPLRRFS